MNRLTRYLSQSRTELSKVTWPSRQNAARLTIAVIAFSLALAAFIGIVDFGFARVLQTLILKG